MKEQRKATPNSEYVCVHELHPETVPDHKKLIRRCIPKNCPWLLTQERYKEWLQGKLHIY